MHLEILAFYFSSENYIPFENLEGHSSSTCVFHLNAYFDILGIENATKFFIHCVLKLYKTFANGLAG